MIALLILILYFIIWTFICVLINACTINKINKQIDDIKRKLK